VNHTTTIGIAAIIALAAITPGILAIGTAYAGGHGRSHSSDGDTFVAKTLTKQKNLCWSVDRSTTDCENDATVFGSNRNEENQGGVTPTPEAACLSAFPSTTFNVRISAAIPGTPVSANDELCITQLGNHAVFDLTAGAQLTLNVANPNAGTNDCPPGSISARVNSITQNAPSPIALGDTVCIHLGPL
jgi:hypothetical protein